MEYTPHVSGLCMLDLPTFVLSTLADLCPPEASILRLDKYRFRVQSKATVVARAFKPSTVLFFELSESLVNACQIALNTNDSNMVDIAKRIRDEVRVSR